MDDNSDDMEDIYLQMNASTKDSDSNNDNDNATLIDID